MHAPPVLNSNITKVQQCCTSVLVLPHSSECVLAQDEVSPVACPRVCDHNCHTTWGAVVRICAPNLLAVANNFSVSRVMFHCLHKGPQMHSHVTNIIVTTVFILFISIIFHIDTTVLTIRTFIYSVHAN